MNLAFQELLQKTGRFLSAMIMPNIGAFIAYGIFATLFSKHGYIPVDGLNTMIQPMLIYLLPFLIATTGGYLMGQERGAITAAIAIIGVIRSNIYVPMFLGAMIIGPLAGYTSRRVDQALKKHTPPGFEMLTNNFTVSIIGILYAIAGYYIFGPVFNFLLSTLYNLVNVLTVKHLLPLVSVLIEPAKILFLNNAINHGIFTPIATLQVAHTGKSIMYMLESNPGPGLGVLLAYRFRSQDKKMNATTNSAIIIQLLGGIHEIYFPYILMNPILIIGPILGNMAAIFWFLFMDCGLTGPASPGSFISYLFLSGPGDLWKVLTGIGISTILSFFFSSFFVTMKPVARQTLEKTDSDTDRETDHANSVITEECTYSIEDEKSTKTMINTEKNKLYKQTAEDSNMSNEHIPINPITKIVFACDVGMGSSALGATRFYRMIHSTHPEITVSNASVDEIPGDCDIAVVQRAFVDRAKASAPQAQIIAIDNYLSDPALDQLFISLTHPELSKSRFSITRDMFAHVIYEEKADLGYGTPNEATSDFRAFYTKDSVSDSTELHANNVASDSAELHANNVVSDSIKKNETRNTSPCSTFPENVLICKEGIRLGCSSTSKEEAIRTVGQLLVDLGYVEAPYIDSMLDREELVTTYMGMGVAIPHGLSRTAHTIRQTGIVLFQYPDGIPFGNEKAQLLIGLAAIGDDHIDLLGKICGLLEEEDTLERLKTTDDIDWVLEQL